MSAGARVALCTSIAAVGLLLAAPARACTPSAERVVAWDAQADRAVIARWSERDKAPGGGTPDMYELRRISTGEPLGLRECAGAAPCDFGAAFAGSVPAAVRWRAPGRPPARSALRVTAAFKEGVHEWALETRAGGKWKRVAWLGFVEGVHQEQRRYTVEASERRGGEVLLAVQYHSQGGNCRRTIVQVLPLRPVDLEDPANAGRRQYLLAHVRQDTPLDHWRTVAELGPLPPERLLEVVEMAEALGRWSWGARWWREGIQPLPADRAAALTAALKKSPNLYTTRALLGLGPMPNEAAHGR